MVALHMPSVDSFSHPLLAALRDAYLDEDLLIFAGGGVSTAGGLPSSKGLVEGLIAGGMREATLTGIADFIERGRLVDALSAAEAALGPESFCAAVEVLLDDRALEAPALAVSIASLAPRLRGALTTSLDHLLEKAFKGAWPGLARVPGEVVRRRHYLLKVHGTLLDRASWALTRERRCRAMYADPKLQTAFTAVFHSSPILFVGYGVTDEDFDEVLARLQAFAGGQPPRRFALFAEEALTTERRTELAARGVEMIPYANPDGKHAEAARILDWLARS